MVRKTSSAPGAELNAEAGSPLNSGPFADSYAALEASLAQAEKDGDTQQQGVLTRELGRVCLEDGRNEFLHGSREVGQRLFIEAEHYFITSLAHFIEAGDATQMFVSQGFKGAAHYNSGSRWDGMAILRRAIVGVRRQGDEVVELDLIVLHLLHQRPEAWVHLRRAFKLTRKGSVNSGRRWEVVAAAIGNDVYDLVMERRQRAQAA